MYNFKRGKREKQIKLGVKEKEVILSNRKEVKKINIEITRLYERELDLSGSLRQSLAKERSLLLKENTKIRKGWIKY